MNWHLGKACQGQIESHNDLSPHEIVDKIYAMKKASQIKAATSTTFLTWQWSKLEKLI